VLKDCGWTHQGKLWVGYHLSENSILSGLCSIPSSLTRFISGDFTLNAVDGSVIGTLATNNTSAWGLKPFIRRKGVEAGDYLVLVFDLPSRIAVAHLGDENLLDDFQLGLSGKDDDEQAKDNEEETFREVLSQGSDSPDVVQVQEAVTEEGGSWQLNTDISPSEKITCSPLRYAKEVEADET
jgi:hypothetical protein